jgi:ribosome-binding protein aMBF1 (putative translation factor)
MKECTKCKELKPIEQYEKYFHSTQNTYRIRGYCKSCFSQQKKKYRQGIKEQKIIQPVSDIEEIEVIPEVVEIVPEVILDPTINKECKNCHIIRPLDRFYNKKGRRDKIGKMPVCKACYAVMYRDKRKKPERDKEKVKLKPNHYWGELQRQDTFELMLALGWSFNEENGKWWKEGIKTSDGLFINITKKVKRKKHRQRRRLFNDEQIETIFIMTKRGLSQQDIADKMNVSQATIGNYLRRYDEEYGTR